MHATRGLVLGLLASVGLMASPAQAPAVRPEKVEQKKKIPKPRNKSRTGIIGGRTRWYNGGKVYPNAKTLVKNSAQAWQMNQLHDAWFNNKFGETV